MPGISVEELRRAVLPAGTEVVAGSLGLDREVTWPVTLRTRPPAFPHVKGGEIALMSGEAMRVHVPPLQLTAVLRFLAGVPASAAAIVGEIPDEARDLADSVGLPLLALPAGSHITELEQAIARAVVDRRTELHQRSQEIYRRLTELAIAGQGLDAILATLADLTGKDVLLEDSSGAPRAWSRQLGPEVLRPLAEDAERVRGWVERTTVIASEPPTLRLSLGADLARVVAPVGVKEDVLAFLSVIGRRGALTELDDVAASRGAAACAIELARERAVLEAEDRLHADLVEALLTGTYSSPEAMLTRARRLGFDLEAPHAALVIGAPPPADGRPPRPAPSIRRLRAALESELEMRDLRTPFGVRDDRLVLFVPQSESTDVKQLARELRDAMAAEAGVPLSCGVGPARAGVDGARQAYREADSALTLGARVLGPGQVAHFADLGIYRLLLALGDSPELEFFHREALGTLVEYDRRNDGELVKTLDAYFACLGSPTEAAERLHVHRNTLLYRLKRIQETARIDLSDSETRLTLHLALRVHDVLQARRPAH